jgi:hypothetical protein
MIFHSAALVQSGHRFENKAGVALSDDDVTAA